MGDGAAGWTRQPHRVGGGGQIAVLAVALRACAGRTWRPGRGTARRRRPGRRAAPPGCRSRSAGPATPGRRPAGWTGSTSTAGRPASAGWPCREDALAAGGPLPRPELLDGLVAADGLVVVGRWAGEGVAQIRNDSMAPSTSPRVSFDMGSSLVGGECARRTNAPWRSDGGSPPGSARGGGRRAVDRLRGSPPAGRARPARAGRQPGRAQRACPGRAVGRGRPAGRGQRAPSGRLPPAPRPARGPAGHAAAGYLFRAFPDEVDQPPLQEGDALAIGLLVAVRRDPPGFETFSWADRIRLAP
jgi:hypothetical protein